MGAVVLTLAACAGLLLPAGSANAAEDADPTSDTGMTVSGMSYHRIRVGITPSRITLTEGKALEVHGVLAYQALTIDAPNENAAEVRKGGYDDRTDATLAYRISMLGKPTPYWLRLAVVRQGSGSPCEIYDGDPSAGGQSTAKAPFSCNQIWKWESETDLRFDVNVWLNRDAEASGTITPHEVSLTDGTFRSDLPYTIPGKTELEPRESTDFDTVYRQTDTSPFYANQARIEFAYQIVDDGKPTGLWAAGLSTNHRGAWFSADSRCAIYDKNPLRGNGHLDWAAPIESDKYYCTSAGDFVSGDGESGRLHYHANFMVRGR